MKPHCQQNGRFSKPSTDKSVVVHPECKDFCHAYPKKKRSLRSNKKNTDSAAAFLGRVSRNMATSPVSFDRTFISIAPKMPNWCQNSTKWRPPNLGSKPLSLSKNLTFEGSDWCKKTSCTGWNDSNIVFKKVQFGVHTPQPRMQSSQGW